MSDWQQERDEWFAQGLLDEQDRIDREYQRDEDLGLEPPDAAYLADAREAVRRVELMRLNDDEFRTLDRIFRRPTDWPAA